MKMHDKKLKLFSIYGKIADVLFILVVVLGSLATLAGIGAAIYLNSTNFDLAEVANFIFKNEIPGASLVLPENIEISYSAIYVVVINMILSFALAAYGIKAVAKMFNGTVSEQTPFTENTVHCIKGIGAAFLIYSGTLCILSLIAGLLAPNPSWSVTLNGGFILIGILVLALGEMFSFGASLQEDSESIL